AVHRAQRLEACGLELASRLAAALQDLGDERVGRERGKILEPLTQGLDVVLHAQSVEDGGAGGVVLAGDGDEPKDDALRLGASVVMGTGDGEPLHEVAEQAQRLVFPVYSASPAVGPHER